MKKYFLLLAVVVSLCGCGVVNFSGEKLPDCSFQKSDPIALRAPKSDDFKDKKLFNDVESAVLYNGFILSDDKTNYTLDYSISCENYKIKQYAVSPSFQTTSGTVGGQSVFADTYGVNSKSYETTANSCIVQLSLYDILGEKKNIVWIGTASTPAETLNSNRDNIIKKLSSYIGLNAKDESLMTH